MRAAGGSGKLGLDLGYTDEIGPLLVKNLTVEGFEVGISTKWPLNSATFDGVTLRNQRRIGWWNYHQMIFVRGLVSENRVPALFNEKNSWGTVTLLDSHLHGINPDRNTPAIHNQRHLYLREVEIVGYEPAVSNDDNERDKGDVINAGLIVEDTSHRNVNSPFRGVEDGTFTGSGTVGHLPVKEAPEIPRGDPEKDLVNLAEAGADPSGEVDASAVMQEIIDSGAETIYLPAGMTFRFASTVEIRGPLRRIIGLEGRFFAQADAVWKLVDGKHHQGLPDAPTVIIE